MRKGAIGVVAAVLLATPAIAGDVEIYQAGRSNWAAINQYNASNRTTVYQDSTSLNGTNYASVAQRGGVNAVASEQWGRTENQLQVVQSGRITYVTAFQSGGEGVNKFQVTQSRLGRR